MTTQFKHRIYYQLNQPDKRRGLNLDLVGRIIFVAVLAVLTGFSFSIFGARDDRAKFTSAVTPVHIRFNASSDSINNSGPTPN